jgi:DNA-binding CsgD family transcriptional regulator
MLSAEQITDYIKSHPDETQAEIAKGLNCSSATVFKLIHHYGISYRPKTERMRNSWKKEICQHQLIDYIKKNPNASQREIAVALGYSQTGISGAIKRNNLEYRIKYEKLGVKSKRKIPRQLLEEYIRQHPNATQNDIAEHFKCSKCWVAEVWKLYNIPYQRKFGKQGRKSILTQKQLEDYLRQNPNARYEEIANFFNCSVSTIYWRLKNCGISHRQRKKTEQKIIRHVVKLSNGREAVFNLPPILTEDEARRLHLLINSLLIIDKRVN